MSCSLMSQTNISSGYLQREKKKRRLKKITIKMSLLGIFIQYMHMQTSLTFKPNIHGVPKILVPRKKMSKFYTGTGVMARWLRALTILLEDPGLVPSTHGGSQPSNSSPGGPDALFWPSRELHAHGAQKHMLAKY